MRYFLKSIFILCNSCPAALWFWSSCIVIQWLDSNGGLLACYYLTASSDIFHLTRDSELRLTYWCPHLLLRRLFLLATTVLFIRIGASAVLAFKLNTGPNLRFSAPKGHMILGFGDIWRRPNASKLIHGRPYCCGSRNMTDPQTEVSPTRCTALLY